MATGLIAVLMGGRSAEREISLQTGEGVSRALETLGYATCTFDDDERLVDGLRQARPAAVFNALHGGAGEDGRIQALLDWLGLGYQGSGVRACAIAMDKWVTKAVAVAQRLPVPRGILVRAQDAGHVVPAQLGFPCVVKPNDEGSAIGVSIVRDPNDLSAALATAHTDRVLVEEFIDGRELTVAVLGDEALPLVEITPHDSFYTYHAKYTPGGSTHTVPAQIDAGIAKTIQEDALALHRALGARDYSRIDVMLDKTGGHYFLECNTLPGLTALSLFPDAARAAGMTYEALVGRLVECARSRTSPAWR
ncbi:MAG TPA: D-alanine--D-alanine ligase [Candidatus Acidoferrales bacterium]|nr:D-alanine--D-alanine ligase [Candidatus Acidoferrales bacterium]